MKTDRALLHLCLLIMFNGFGFVLTLSLINRANYLMQARMDGFERQLLDMSIQAKTQGKRLADLERKK